MFNRMIAVSAIAFILTACIAAAAAAASAGDCEMKKNDRVVFIGDSLTDGFKG